MGVDLFSKLRGSISLPFPPLLTARGLVERCKLPQRGPGQSHGRRRIYGAFRAQNRVWWQQCDMSHNHSLIINIHWHLQRLCSLCFITVLQIFCEGPNNGGPSLAKFHEGPDLRTFAGSTPMYLVYCEAVRSAS